MVWEVQVLVSLPVMGLAPTGAGVSELASSLGRAYQRDFFHLAIYM
jgi:hypothetical protein